MCRALTHSFGDAPHRCLPPFNLHGPASATTTGGFLLTALCATPRFRQRASTAGLHGRQESRLSYLKAKVNALRNDEKLQHTFPYALKM